MMAGRQGTPSLSWGLCAVVVGAALILVSDIMQPDDFTSGGLVVGGLAVLVVVVGAVLVVAGLIQKRAHSRTPQA